MNTTEESPAARGLLATAIQRPVTVVASLLLVVFFGVLAIADLPIQLTPDISTPTITVNTRWPGASPIEVETEILEEQEEVLKRVQGLTRMESTASQSNAQVTLEFEVGSDIEQALVRVSNQLSQVPDYPEAADQPVVSTSNASGPPLAVILVRHNEGASVAEYRTWVEEEIVPEIERVRGVASMFMRGGRESELQVNFDTEALAARQLTVPEVAERIRREIRNASAGELDIGKRRLTVRTMVTFADPLDLEQLVLKVGRDNAVVRLADVAQVEQGWRKQNDFAIGDDRESIALLPRREAGTNVLEVTEALRATVERLNEERFAPEGLTLEVVDDQSGYIYEALELVRVNLMIGAALATLTLLLFLRSVAASAIVALAIPICALGTALVMAALGRSVNVVSLAGLTFAVGMVVDNSIVALENIDTWRRKVHDSKQAALIAIREVWGALLASSATTAAVFIPILLWEGEVGELLRDIAWAIAIAVMLSLAVSVLAIPSLAARWLKPKTPGAATVPQGSLSKLARPLVDVAARFKERVLSASRFVLRGPLTALVTVMLALAGASAVSLYLLPKMEYLPTGNRNLVFGIVLPPPGYNVDELIKAGFENQREMMRHTGKSVDGVPAIHRSFFVGDPARLIIGGVAKNPDEVKELRDYMRSLHAKMPGTIGFASQAALFAGGIGEGRAVEVEIAGNNLEELVSVGGQLFGELRKLVPGAQVRPIPLLDLGAQEFHLQPRRAEIAALGLTPSDVALISDAYVDGAILGEFGAEGERKLDIVLKNKATRSWDENSLGDAPVATPGGRVVPFSVLADIETGLGPTVIQRLERKRAVVLQLTPPDEVPFETAINKVETRVAELVSSGKLPASVKLSIGGSAGKLATAQQQFIGILSVAVVILYLLLAGLFEDYVAPLVVLTTVPLAAAGGVLGLSAVNLWLAPQQLDLMTALGFLILIGVVVNNAILIVDGAIARLRDGLELREATLEAVRRRARPIFMSTLTSLAGLLPMVLASGSGSELYRGVGAIVLGGLTVSTLLAFFVVPSLFYLLWAPRLRKAAATVS